MPYSASDEIFISVTIDGSPRSWHELQSPIKLDEGRTHGTMAIPSNDLF